MQLSVRQLCAAALLGLALCKQEPGYDNILREQTSALLDKNNLMPTELAVFFAAAWVLMMGSVPLVLRYVAGKPLTHVQMLCSGLMWLAIFGGLYLFCNVIIFQGPHFEEPRTLFLVECIYMMAQVITTVGYGDITPAYPRGQIFIGLYVIMAIFVIANIVSEVIDYITMRAATFKAASKAEKHKQQSTDHSAAEQREHAALMVLKHTERPSFAPFVRSIIVFLGFAFVWVLFFHLYPGEGKTWFQAIYMSVITLSTVGFGAFLPNTHAGMVFAAFWMIFGTAALVQVVSNFTEIMVHYAEYERFNIDDTTDALKAWSESNRTDGMSEPDFLQFGLHQAGVVADAEVELARRAFEALKDREGYVNFSTLRMQC